MPITNFEQLIDFSKICGTEIPTWIFNRLKLYRNDSESLKSFGQEVVSQMCLNLKENGVNSFHFYSMNKSEPGLSIAKAII